MIQIKILVELQDHACSFLSLNGNRGKPGEKEYRKEEAGSGQTWGSPLLTSYSTQALGVTIACL